MSATGEVLAGRYRIDGVIGAGGMGTVYRAHDLELDEPVALKMLRRELVEQPDMLERFRREVKLARRVTHRNVARTFDLGEHGGDKFLTMELIDGPSLAALSARDGKLPWARVVELATQVCAGLAAAHAAGVVHRDLKPDNVVVDGEGRVAITDFGIARVFDSPASPQTQGLVVGTPAYMAPEQVDGASSLDARTDLYALGVMLFELCTGHKPWRGETSVAVAAARLTEAPPDPRALAPELPAPLAALVLRLMARWPADRYADAAEVGAALAAITRPTPAPVSSPLALEETRELRRPGAPRRRRLVLAVAAAVTIGGVAVTWRGSRRAPDEAPLAAPPPPPASDAGAAPVTGTPYERGREHVRRLDGPAARAAFEEAVVASPNDGRARVALALMMLGYGDRRAAGAEATRALATGALADPAIELQARAIVLLAANDAAGAAALLGPAFALEPDLETGLLLVETQLAAGQTTAAESTLARLRTLPPPDADDPRISNVDAAMAEVRGDFAHALRVREAVADRFEQRGWLPGLATMRALVLWDLVSMGEHGEVRRRAGGALRLAERVGDRLMQAGVLQHAANATAMQGEPRRAYELIERAVELSRQSANPYHAWMLHDQAQIAAERGDLALARRIFDIVAVDPLFQAFPASYQLDLLRAMERQRAGDLRSARALLDGPLAAKYVGFPSTQSGNLAMAEGDWVRARTDLERALDDARKRGMVANVTNPRALIGELMVEEGAWASAVPLLQQAIDELAVRGMRPVELRAQVALAAAYDALGRRDDAALARARANALLVGFEDPVRAASAHAALALAWARTNPAGARAALTARLAILDEGELQGAALELHVALATIDLDDPALAAAARTRLRALDRVAERLGQGRLRARIRARLK